MDTKALVHKQQELCDRLFAVYSKEAILMVDFMWIVELALNGNGIRWNTDDEAKNACIDYENRSGDSTPWDCLTSAYSVQQAFSFLLMMSGDKKDTMLTALLCFTNMDSVMRDL